jgi:hypothetical protein
MSEEITFETVTEKVIDGLVREFKDHEKAPKSENLVKTICRYALKISDIYELLEEKPDYWFDPVVIKQLMDADFYDGDMWLFTICGEMDNLEFLKEVENYLLSVEDRIAEREEQRRNLEEKREKVKAILREEGYEI